MTEQTGNDPGRHLRAVLQTFKPDVYKVTLTAGVSGAVFIFGLILWRVSPSLAHWLGTLIARTLVLLIAPLGGVYGVLLGLWIGPLAIIYGLVCLWWAPLPARARNFRSRK
jgi:hypothetical protein